MLASARTWRWPTLSAATGPLHVRSPLRILRPTRSIAASNSGWRSRSPPVHRPVAALIGVTPAAVDPGQPIRLALNKDAASKYAASAPVAAPQPQPQAQLAEAAPAPSSVEPVAAPAPQPAVAQSAPTPIPVEPQAANQAIAAAAAMSPEAPAAFAAMSSSFAPAPKPARGRRSQFAPQSLRRPTATPRPSFSLVRTAPPSVSRSPGSA